MAMFNKNYKDIIFTELSHLISNNDVMRHIDIADQNISGKVMCVLLL